MLIDQYYQQKNGTVSFSRQQGSDFAKQISDDFNPLHDVDARRFCVPGDLLFSLVLAKYGISKHMSFTFLDMVTEGVHLLLPAPSSELHIKGDNDKDYLSIERSDDIATDSDLIDNLTQSYVTFSGQTFPHILIPLMQQHNVMINPNRPMVMYQSMLIDLDRTDLSNISLELDQQKTAMEVIGKRGNACLAFNLLAHGEIIGRGEKHMILSGLRPYEQSVIDTIIADHAGRKHNYPR
ncbi:MAG: hypothetical protein ACJAYG_000485 [Oceanicoccus sp.]|jgi:hypothetical protein